MPSVIPHFKNNYMKRLKTRPVAITVVFVLAAGIFILQGCSKEHLPDPVVYFQQDVFPVIISNCTQSGCHGTVATGGEFRLTSYNDILRIVSPGDYKGSRLYQALVRPVGYMPQGSSRLSDEDIRTIALWIEQGAENNSGDSGCNTDNVTYSNTVAPILQAWCYSCHSGSFPSGNIKLDAYSAVRPLVDNGKLLGTIRHETGYLPMPDGGGKMPTCEISKIEQWVSDGAPDN